jgi:hypothetical protein
VAKNLWRKEMKIYRVSIPSSLDLGWDSYDSFVCVAEDEDEARNLHPIGCGIREKETEHRYSDWVKTSQVHLLKVEYIGEAKEEYKEATIICASFNAG